jgi:hypothetical protein
MMFRRAFVDLVFVPPDHDLRLYVDFYLSTFAALLTGVIAIHQALYAYRMHGRNKHSNATVLGGRYNSSTQAWEAVRTATLQLIRSVMQSEAEAILMAFGRSATARPWRWSPARSNRTPSNRRRAGVACWRWCGAGPPVRRTMDTLQASARARGEAVPAEASAVFAGVARNCASYLPEVLGNLGRFAGSYARTSFVFAVSDTTDDSLAILERWLGDGRHGKAIDLGSLADRLPKRTERIAHARNTCLDEIRRSEWAGYDHLVMADLDDVLAFPCRPMVSPGRSLAQRRPGKGCRLRQCGAALL